jgi:hypothetical protein
LLLTGLGKYHLLPSAWLKYRPPCVPLRGFVNFTHREPLSEKLPDQRAPELLVQVLPSQLV